jgi:tRNA1(Val) A37 N6-methylase TrmN6
MSEALGADLFEEPVAPPTRSVKPKAASRKSQLGQFMTPAPIARFMAGLFVQPFPSTGRLLDAGAGMGSLTTAFVDRWRQGANGQCSVDAYEADDVMLTELRSALHRLERADGISFNIVAGDFIAAAAAAVRLGRGARYTHAILNPPYKKINNSSSHRELLSAAGLETVNLYSGFVGLAVELLQPGGEIVAIIPRSFCNGPYYQPFRRYILQRASIKQIHLFDSRNKAFKEDGVLQENIILHMQRGVPQGPVTISTSEDDSFADYKELVHPFERVVFPTDTEQFIHIPTDDDTQLLLTPAFRHSMAEIGVSVSTGPVVDFRMRDDLCAQPEAGTVPLLYPGHFVNDVLEWPRADFKKANAIRHTALTEKWLYPAGFYAVVRRFSSKEERRRIVANVVDPTRLGASMIGFENHLNVFHHGRKPLPEDLSRGLAVYLNSTLIDQYFRRFNGHTQVNATDLRTLRYPSRDVLIGLGQWAKGQKELSQAMIDEKVSHIA